MDRRRFLAAGAALAAAPVVARAEVDDLRTAAREAWLYGLPLIEMASARSRMLDQGAEVNAFRHQRQPSTPRSRDVTTPNCDTLYSSAWLDLSKGPVTVVVPATGQRYFSLALIDMYTNNIAVIGPDRTGGEGGAFTIVGPPGRMGVGDVTVPRPHMPDMPMRRRPIHAPGRWVWALGRTLIGGPSDLDNAHEVQNALYVRAHGAGRPAGAYADRSAPWNDYFYAVQQLIDESPPPVEEIEYFRRIAPLQLGMLGGFEKARFADADIGQIEAGVAEARALMTASIDRPDPVGGWIYPKPDLGDFGQDYLYRARSALGGLGALPTHEALYLRAVGPDGRSLFPGEGAYRLSLPGALPADGFWSLTLYEATPEGQLFLADNPIGRYAVGDRTGLRRNPDGSYDIWIGRADPGGARSDNWLPGPARGPFALILRAYLPRPELIDGRYRLPPVVREDPAPDPPVRRRRR